MKKIVLFASLALGSFLFTGCGSSLFWFNATPVKSGGVVQGMDIKHVRVKGVNKKDYPYKNYEDSSNVTYRCAYNFALHGAATKTLQNGYRYFTLEFPEGSNPTPISINSISKLDRYCNAPHWDKETSLLEDKCGHIGVGAGTPFRVKSIRVKYFKNRNPLIPTWDASKTKRETWNTLTKECFVGKMDVLNEMMQDYNSL